MTKKPWKPTRHRDEATMQAPKFLPGDPIVAVDDGTPGRVEFARHDGQVCVVWDHSSKREWCHEDVITWPANFQPQRRR
jgi:hypothetical protein